MELSFQKGAFCYYYLFSKLKHDVSPKKACFLAFMILKAKSQYHLEKKGGHSLPFYLCITSFSKTDASSIPKEENTHEVMPWKVSHPNAPPGSPWTPTPMPPSGCGGRRQTPSAPPLARRCNNQSEKAQARTGIPVRACLVSAFSNCKFNITEWFEIDRKFYSCGPPIVPIFHPVRSAPHSRMGQGLGQRRTAKANRSKEFSKMKIPCKSHGFARLWWRLQNSNLWPLACEYLSNQKVT